MHGRSSPRSAILLCGFFFRFALRDMEIRREQPVVVRGGEVPFSLRPRIILQNSQVEFSVRWDKYQMIGCSCFVAETWLVEMQAGCTLEGEVQGCSGRCGGTAEGQQRSAVESSRRLIEAHIRERGK